jgi:anti-sigma B factor antagonist
MAIADGGNRRQPPFEVQHVVSGGSHTLVLRGELDMTTASDLEAEIASSVESASELTLDLSELTFMDSTGIGVVLFAQRLCQETGTGFAVVPGIGQVQQVFEVTGLVDILPFRPESRA